MAITYNERTATYDITGSDPVDSNAVPQDTPIENIRYRCNSRGGYWGDREFRRLATNQIESLKAAGYETVGDLDKTTTMHLEQLDGIGSVSAGYIQKAASRMGIKVYGPGDAVSIRVPLPPKLIEAIDDGELAEEEVKAALVSLVEDEDSGFHDRIREIRLERRRRALEAQKAELAKLQAAVAELEGELAV